MRGDKERDEKDQDEGAALFDLTMVKGIGPRYAERLKALGIDSVMALRDYDVTILAQTLGISEKTVADWVANAKETFK